MRLETAKKGFDPLEADVLLAPVREADADADGRGGILALLKKAGLDVAALFKDADFNGRPDRTLVHRPLRSGLPSRIVFVGLGDPDVAGEEAYRRAAAVASKVSGEAATYAWPLDPRDDALRAAEAVATGFSLARYKFDRYLSKPAGAAKKKARASKFVVVPAKESDRAAAAEGVEVASALRDAVFFARDLGNLPGNRGTPTILADETKAMAKREGIRCRVLDEAAARRLKMGSFLSVSLGSVTPPKFLELEYGRRRKGVPTIALVGKGLTFDSGGISIKPSADMDKMRHDKCGGAAVLGVMLAAARLKIAAHLVCLVPCTENMPGRDANKPGDVVVAMNGKSIEILNTDAEGRLILADALCYAERFDPDYVIDVATLTGSCAATFGNHVTGLFGSDDVLCDRLHEAGKETHERVWRLPLYEDYDQLMKGTTTDLKNLGGPRGGAITAACFLRHFVDGRRWAHLDIAGTAWDDGVRPYNPASGASGVGVRLLLRLVMSGLPVPSKKKVKGSARKR
jgi:leucyl aminopeptidase